ncbi:MAG: hypothetical protein QGG40_14090, partial [Myxococcota bacterium]|nr:hypothetical protein [Myxococcota bacterium]
MAELNLREGEQTLACEGCMMHRGPLAHSGRLTLTNVRLHFSLTGRLDKMVGAEDVEAPIAEIDSVEIKGLDNTLVVSLPKEQLRFSGKGARRLADRLRALLAEKGGQQEATVAFAPGERIVLQGDIDVYLKGMIASRGEVTLTDRRLRVVTRGGLESLLFQGKEVDAPLTGIRGVKRDGRVHVLTEDQQLVLGGALSSQLFAILRAMGVGSDQPVVPIHDFWKCSLQKGPLAVPGVLAVSQARLFFLPLGKLDAMVGAREVMADLHRVLRCELKGWPDRRLWIESTSGELAFSFPEIDKVFRQLVDVITGAEPQGFSRGLVEGSRARIAREKFLARWQVHLEDEEQFSMLERCAWWSEEFAVHKGWFVLTSERFLYLPLAGLQGELAPSSFPLSDL